MKGIEKCVKSRLRGTNPPQKRGQITGKEQNDNKTVTSRVIYSRIMRIERDYGGGGP